MQASLPALVREPGELYALNGLMDGTRRLALALGPSGAGLLVLLLPLPQFFTLNALSFLISAATVAAIGGRFAWRGAADGIPTAGSRGIVREIGGALTLVRGHRALAYGITANAASNLGWGAAFNVGIPLLADRVLGGGGGGLRDHRRGLRGRQYHQQPRDRQPDDPPPALLAAPGPGLPGDGIPGRGRCPERRGSRARLGDRRHRAGRWATSSC